MRKTYRELIELPSFLERFEYLKLNGGVGRETFGSARWMNQDFYHSKEWKLIRNHIILRDDGCDLGIIGRPIRGQILIHHINPITEDHIEHADTLLLDPDNLICVSFMTHEAIHYGSAKLLPEDPIARYPNDTCPWKGGRL